MLKLASLLVAATLIAAPAQASLTHNSHGINSLTYNGAQVNSSNFNGFSPTSVGAEDAVPFGDSHVIDIVLAR